MGMIENLETAQAAESARTVKPHQETADSYAAVVAQLNDQWRVIECRDGIQWILQRRDGQRAGQPRWMGVRYCPDPRGADHGQPGAVWLL